MTREEAITKLKEAVKIPDREKVIKGLKICMKADETYCVDCPYYRKGILGCAQLSRDALELIEGTTIPESPKEKRA